MRYVKKSESRGAGYPVERSVRQCHRRNTKYCRKRLSFFGSEGGESGSEGRLLFLCSVCLRFLEIVALIAAFNIINSIGMGTSARMRQYGAMRAIGTSVRQLKSMVVAETSAYVIRGLLTGLGAGLPLHHFLYQRIITSRWGDAWNLPVSEFCVIAMVMIGAAAAAVAGPIRRISGMSVVETISVQ